MREVAAQQIGPESGVPQQTAPWLAFSIHHGAHVHLHAAVDRTAAEGRKSGLSLAVEASLSGSLAVLVGPSGAGKTSLLRSIAGLMRPRHGYVTVGDKTVWDSGRHIWLRPAERGCGLVMQRSALFPAMTAREMSSMWTIGRHGVPSDFKWIFPVVCAQATRLFNTMSNRIRGETP